MAKCERAAIYQIIRRDANFLGCATDIFDGDIRAFCRALGENTFRYIYRVREITKLAESNKIVFPDFDPFIACCFERGNMTMIVDEAHFLCNPRYIPVRFWQSIITGRHMYIDIIYLTQRFSMVHHDLTANTHEFVFWNITEPADLAGIEQRCGEEVRNKVISLRKAVDLRSQGGTYTPGESLVWNTSSGGYQGERQGSSENSNSASDASSAAVDAVPAMPS